MRQRSGGPVREPDQHEPPDGEQPSDPAAAARNLMLRRLAARARTRGELADLLAERGIPDEVAEQALDRFTEVGLINDAAFATDFVAVRSTGRGRTLLRSELLRRGVDPDLATTALAGLTPEAERSAAERFATRRWRAMASVEPAVRRRRLVAALVRRGFAAGLAFDVVARLDPSGASDPLGSGVEEDL